MFLSSLRLTSNRFLNPACTSITGPSVRRSLASNPSVRIAGLDQTELNKVIRPGDDAREIGDVFPELLTPQEREEKEAKKAAHELLRYKLHKLKEKMEPRKIPLNEVYVDATGIIYRKSNFANMTEEDIFKFHTMNADDLFQFAPGKCAGHIPYLMDKQKRIVTIIRRPFFLAAELMRTHPLGKSILIRPRDNMPGIGVSVTLDSLALFCRHMGWLTILIPDTKKLVQNFDYIEKNSRDPFFFDQPFVARRFLEDLVESQGPFLHQWTLKQKYSSETHGYSEDDILSAREDPYEPFEIPSNFFSFKDLQKMAKTDLLKRFFSKEATQFELAEEYCKLHNLHILEEHVSEQHKMDAYQESLVYGLHVEKVAADEEKNLDESSDNSTSESSTTDFDGDFFEVLFGSKSEKQEEKENESEEKKDESEEKGELEETKAPETESIPQYVLHHDLHAIGARLASEVFDSPLNPQWERRRRRRRQTEGSTEPLNLYDLATFGIKDESELLVTNVAIDLLNEIRNNTDPSRICAVIINDANWFDGKCLHRHPDDYKLLSSRRLSLQNAIAQFLESPPQTGFSILGLTPEIAAEKSEFWTTQVDYSFFVDRYSRDEVRQWLLYQSAYGFIDAEACFGESGPNTMMHLQAATGFRAKEFEEYVHKIDFKDVLYQQ